MYVDVDRAKAKSMDVPLTNVFDTLQIYLGSAYVNDFHVSRSLVSGDRSGGQQLRRDSG